MRDEALLSIVPANRKRAYDMRRLIRHIVDLDSVFEVQPLYAPNLITCYARLDGHVVGVVANARNDGVGEAVQPAIYVPYTFDLEVYTEILVHTDGSLASVFKAAREEVRNVDGDQQVEGQGEIVSLESMVTQQQEWRQAHLATILLGTFAFLALALAGVGLYSVVSYRVAQRTNELGIRIAFGAQQKDVLTLVVASAAVSVGCGLAAGVFLSVSGAKLVARWTQVSASSPLVRSGAEYF